jgi:hypothetical protein
MLHPFVWSAFLVAACTSAPQVTPPADAPPQEETVETLALQETAPPQGCLEPGEAEAAARRLEKLNTQSLEAALARAGLERFAPAELAQVMAEGHYYPAPPGRDPFHPEWGVFVDAEGRNVLAGPRVRMNCGADPHFQPPRFVRSGQGELFVLEAVPVARTTRDILSCGCPPHVFGGCGAYMPFTMQQRWVLPQGLRFGGIRRVPYEVVRVNRTYARQEGCPAPIYPPSAPRGPSRPVPPPGIR